MKQFLKNIILITLPTLFIILLLLELFFRFIIPSAQYPQAIFDETVRMCLYKPHTEGVYTMGKLARQRGKWGINNYGWNSECDYEPQKEKGRIAIIGDSYIEALQVDVDKSYTALLRDEIGDEYDVYSFGFSGAPLSHYLHISRYVNEIFNPDCLIFNLIHNDFMESILELAPSNFYFLTLSIKGATGDIIIENTPKPDYTASEFNLKKRLLKKSALVRYLFFNLGFKECLSALKESGKDKHYNANIEINKVKDNKDNILKATAYILRQIKRENPEKRIIFIMDAPRNDIYSGNPENGSLLFLHEILNGLCIKNGFELIDLTLPMKRAYEQNHIKFNSEIDAHWNEYGHRFVSEEVVKLFRIDGWK